MKKTLSFVLALIMVLAMVPATVALAASVTTGTISAYNADQQFMGTYTTIDSAAAAAGEGGTIEMSAGDFYFNGRQTIAVNNITLRGTTNSDGIATHFCTSDTYGGSTKTNRKALFTVSASGITVENIAFDGGEYGRTLVPQYDDEGETEFSVVRINSGSATFNNVSIMQSERTLLTIGTSSTSATLSATDLYCIGNSKHIPTIADWNVFADIDVENGTFSCTSGELDAFLQVKKTTGHVTNMPAYHYTLDNYLFDVIALVDVKTTAKHFVDSYKYIVEQGGTEYSTNIGTFVNIIKQNIGSGDEVTRIVDNMCANPSHFGSETVHGMIDLLNDVKSRTSGSAKTTIGGFITRLEALYPAN